MFILLYANCVVMYCVSFYVVVGNKLYLISLLPSVMQDRDNSGLEEMDRNVAILYSLVVIYWLKYTRFLSLPNLQNRVEIYFPTLSL